MEAEDERVGSLGKLKNIPQGLKPDVYFVVCGPAEAVPLLQNR